MFLFLVLIVLCKYFLQSSQSFGILCTRSDLSQREGSSISIKDARNVHFYLSGDAVSCIVLGMATGTCFVGSSVCGESRE